MSSGDRAHPAPCVAGRIGEQTTDYTEWKTFGGLNLPTAYTVSANGEKIGGGQVKSLEINPSVDVTAFDKPGK